MKATGEKNGGRLVADVLVRHGVPFLFTLIGGHISPIVVGAKERGIRVIDVRHEATAVFAADAVSRLSGTVGVAAVTAGPGVTNTVTALKNAQMAESPLVVLGGAAATMLQGRGALQDIDQMAVVEPHVKWAAKVKRVSDIGPTVTEAFARAQSGVPGPVFVELPLDVLYPEAQVRELYLAGSKGKSIQSRLLRGYLRWHVRRLFRGAANAVASAPLPVDVPTHSAASLQEAAAALKKAQRPVLVVSSQALLDAERAAALQQAILDLGLPTFLSGMARGLLGLTPLHIRHGRTRALREADLIILAGVACDFRLNYGRSLGRHARLISINRSKEELHKNCKPDQAVHADPGAFLRDLAPVWQGDATLWSPWLATLQERNSARDAEIAAQAKAPTEFVNPLHLCHELEACLPANSVLIGDGGDFVATASYIVRPRAPLSWLDPGAFGTLGSGAGFALGARLCRPDAEIWLLYGDGSAGYTIAEFDTFARHGLPIIALVGNDASWMQIAREQVPRLGDAVGTELARADYHVVAEGFGGAGLCVAAGADVAAALQQAQALAAEGRPVLVNALIGHTDFRKGSISV